MIQTIQKWLLLLCIVSFLFNGLLYLGNSNEDMLINIYGSIGIGVATAIWYLIAKKKT